MIGLKYCFKLAPNSLSKPNSLNRSSLIVGSLRLLQYLKPQIMNSHFRLLANWWTSISTMVFWRSTTVKSWFN